MHLSGNSQSQAAVGSLDWTSMYWVHDECNTIFRIRYQHIYYYTLPGSLAAVDLVLLTWCCSDLEASLALHQVPYHLFVASSRTEFTSTACLV